MKKKVFTVFSIGVFLCAFLFGLFLFKNQFYFYFDSGRDAYEAYSIFTYGDFKIQGPSSDIPGVHHGVGWYYFLILPYLLGRGDPFFAGLFLFIIVFSTLPFVWYLTYSIFKNKLIANGVILLYSFSPAFLLASRWLSNPSLAFIIVPLLLFILWKFVEKQDLKKSFSIGILYGSLLHADIAYLICLISLPLIYLVFRIKLKLSEIFFIITGLLIALIPFFLVEIKFKGKGIKSVLGYLETNSSSFDLGQFIKIFITKMNELFDFSIFGTGSIIVLLIVSLLFLFTVKRINPFEKKPLYFILVWMSALLLFFLFETGFTKGKYVFFPYLLPAVILLVFMLNKVINNKIILALTLLILFFFEINSNLELFKAKSNPYTVQNGMILSDLKKAIDYTYIQSGNEAFVIKIISNV